MSQENVEVVRQVIGAIRSDDLDARIDAVVARSHPSIEFRSVLAAVEGATYRGHHGIRRYFGDMAGSWQEWRTEPEEVVELDPRTVFAHVCVRAVGRDSGVVLELRVAVAFVLSDSKLVRMHSCSSREEALEAVGLRE